MSNLLSKETEGQLKLFDVTPLSDIFRVNIFNDDDNFEDIVRVLGLDTTDYDEGITLAVVGVKEYKHI
jgi:hypothetical protein